MSWAQTSPALWSHNRRECRHGEIAIVTGPIHFTLHFVRACWGVVFSRTSLSCQNIRPRAVRHRESVFSDKNVVALNFLYSTRKFPTRWKCTPERLHDGKTVRCQTKTAKKEKTIHLTKTPTKKSLQARLLRLTKNEHNRKRVFVLLSETQSSCTCHVEHFRCLWEEVSFKSVFLPTHCLLRKLDS